MTGITDTVASAVGAEPATFPRGRNGNTLAEVQKEAGPGGTDAHQDYVCLDNLLLRSRLAGQEFIAI